MAERIDVFISSTSRDLEAYRDAVTQVVLRLGLHPIIMEAFNATDRNALQLCYDKVQETEIFVGIYAHRYGYAPSLDVTYSLPDDTEKTGDGETSITHLEYLWAMERNLPMLLFVISDTDAQGNPLAWPVSFIEDNPGKTRLKNFKNMIMGKHVVGFFHSPDHLATQVATGLAEIKARLSPSSGAVAQRTARSDFYKHIQLPPNYVPRQDLIAELRLALLEDTAIDTNNILAFHGMGGIGKSVMARALCDDPAVHEAFPDGILWASLGQEPNLTMKLREWIDALGGVITENVPTLDSLKSTLAELLQDKSCLLVVDDVWQKKHGEAFRVGGDHCKLLLTTRDAETVRAIGAKIKSIPTMSSVEAIELLRDWAGNNLIDSDKQLLNKIINRLGKLPLAIKLAGAQLQRKSPEKWLERFDARKLKVKRSDEIHDNLELTFGLSLDELDEVERKLYAALAIFKEDEPIREVAINKLWSALDDYDDDETEDLIDDLAARALLQVVGDEFPRAAVLHDLLRDLMASELGSSTDAHGALLSAYQETQSSDGWHTAQDDGYLYDHLAYHLVEAEKTDELLCMLLDNPQWMHTRFEQDYSYGFFVQDVQLLIDHFGEVTTADQIANLITLHVLLNMVLKRGQLNRNALIEYFAYTGQYDVASRLVKLLKPEHRADKLRVICDGMLHNGEFNKQVFDEYWQYRMLYLEESGYLDFKMLLRIGEDEKAELIYAMNEDVNIHDRFRLRAQALPNKDYAYADELLQKITDSRHLALVSADLVRHFTDESLPQKLPLYIKNIESYLSDDIDFDRDHELIYLFATLFLANSDYNEKIETLLHRWYDAAMDDGRARKTFLYYFSTIIHHFFPQHALIFINPYLEHLYDELHNTDRKVVTQRTDIPDLLYQIGETEKAQSRMREIFERVEEINEKRGRTNIDVRLERYGIEVFDAYPMPEILAMCDNTVAYQVAEYILQDRYEPRIMWYMPGFVLSKFLPMLSETKIDQVLGKIALSVKRSYFIENAGSFTIKSATSQIIDELSLEFIPEFHIRNIFENIIDSLHAGDELYDHFSYTVCDVAELSAQYSQSVAAEILAKIFQDFIKWHSNDDLRRALRYWSNVVARLGLSSFAIDRVDQIPKVVQGGDEWKLKEIIYFSLAKRYASIGNFDTAIEYIKDTTPYYENKFLRYMALLNLPDEILNLCSSWIEEKASGSDRATEVLKHQFSVASQYPKPIYKAVVNDLLNEDYKKYTSNKTSLLDMIAMDHLDSHAVWRMAVKELVKDHNVEELDLDGFAEDDNLKLIQAMFHVHQSEFIKSISVAATYETTKNIWGATTIFAERFVPLLPILEEYFPTITMTVLYKCIRVWSWEYQTFAKISDIFDEHGLVDRKS